MNKNFYVCVLVMAVVGGCSGASFEGGATQAGKSMNAQPKSAGKSRPAPDVSEPDDVEPTIQQEYTSAAKVEEPGIVQVPTAVVLPADHCEVDRGKIRVVLTFDNSSSNSRETFQAMNNGANHFAKKLADFTAVKGNPLVRLAVVRMDDPSKNKGAQTGPRRWFNIDQANMSAVAEEMQWGTTKGHNTYFDETFMRARELFDEEKAKADKTNERNFVIFFTDGGAEREGGSDALTEALASKYGAAVYTIGTDGDEGADLLAQLAKPRTGIVSPGHVGKFFPTKSGNDITNAFDEIFKKAEVKLCKE